MGFLGDFDTGPFDFRAEAGFDLIGTLFHPSPYWIKDSYVLYVWDILKVRFGRLSVTSRESVRRVGHPPKTLETSLIRLAISL